MKIIAILFSVFFSISLVGQSIDSLGLGDNKYFNLQEFQFLNNAAIYSKNPFDFANKKVAFISGRAGEQIITKKDYFERYVKPIIARGEKFNPLFVKLTSKEKGFSNGFDVLILAYSPLMFTDKQKLKILNELKIK